MATSSMNGTPPRSNVSVDKIEDYPHSFTTGMKTNSYQLSPSEDKISFIRNDLEVLIYDVAKTTLDEAVEFSSKILSQVTIYDPFQVTIFSGDVKGCVWTWNSTTRIVCCIGVTLIRHPILGLWYNEYRDLLVAFDKHVFTVFSVMNRSIRASLQVLQDGPTGAYVNFAGLGLRMITYCYEAQEIRLQKLVLWNLNPVSKMIERKVSLVDTPQVHESWLIAQTMEGDVEIWDTKEGATVRIITPFNSAISGIHPLGQFIFIIGEDRQGHIKVFDLASGVCKSTTPLEDNCFALRAEIDPTGRFFIVVKDLEAYTDEGEGFLQIYKIEKSDVTFVTSVSSEKPCPIKTGPLLAFSPDGGQVYVSCVVATERQMENPDAKSITWIEGVSHILLYDIVNQKKMCFAPHRLGKQQRLLKTGALEKGKIFIENLTSPHFIQFSSTLGGEAHYLYFNPKTQHD